MVGKLALLRHGKVKNRRYYRIIKVVKQNGILSTVVKIDAGVFFHRRKLIRTLLLNMFFGGKGEGN